MEYNRKNHSKHSIYGDFPSEYDHKLGKYVYPTLDDKNIEDLHEHFTGLAHDPLSDVSFTLRLTGYGLRLHRNESRDAVKATRELLEQIDS